MYGISIIKQNKEIPEQANNINKIAPLLKSILGYTDDEISRMIELNFIVNGIAKNLTKEQVVLAFQPFLDIDAPMFIDVYDDVSGELIECAIDEAKLGMVKQTPKPHYYSQPIISRKHLISPDYVPKPKSITIKPQPTTPTITCPYCKSTDCKKITATAKAVNVALFGIFGNKRRYQWHCNSCKSDF